jgi:anti-anti-sigma regulatory factor
LRTGAVLAAGILTIRLPEQMSVENRLAVFRLASERTEPYRRLRLDASGTRSIDGAAMGTLARIVRLARDKTDAAPILLNPTAFVLELLRSTMLLQFFEVQSQGGA